MLGSQRNESFCLIITEPLVDKIYLVDKGCYSFTHREIFRIDDDINQILLKPELQAADILFVPYNITDDSPFKNIVLNSHQRFIRISCCKTPVDLLLLSDFLIALQQTNCRKQKDKAEKALQILSSSEQILFTSVAHNTTASLTINDELLWTMSDDAIAFGESFVFPGGEIAISHTDLDSAELPALTNFNGELAFHGMPVLHRVMPEKYLPDTELDRIFNCFFSLQKAALIIEVKAGKIANIRSPNRQSKEVASMLEALISFDNRLEMIAEIGFGLDHTISLLSRNTVLNEPYCGRGICVHFGLGDIRTAIHLDIICPETDIYGVSKGQKIPIHTIQ